MENVSCVWAQHFLDTVTPFHRGLLSGTSLRFFLRSPRSGFIITAVAHNVGVTGAVVSPAFLKEGKIDNVWAPFQVSAQILKLIILKVHTANVILPSVWCEREVPPLTTYRFYLCDLTAPPSQPAPIPGGKAIEPPHTPQQAHKHTRTHTVGVIVGVGGGLHSSTWLIDCRHR